MTLINQTRTKVVIKEHVTRRHVLLKAIYNGTVYSGAPLRTTLGNDVRGWVAMTCLLAQHELDEDVVYYQAGDDSLAIVEEDKLQQFLEMLKEAYAMGDFIDMKQHGLGMRLKDIDISSNYGYFCSRWFFFSTHEVYATRIPTRVLQTGAFNHKVGKSVTKELYVSMMSTSMKFDTNEADIPSYAEVLKRTQKRDSLVVSKDVKYAVLLNFDDSIQYKIVSNEVAAPHDTELKLYFPQWLYTSLGLQLHLLLNNKNHHKERVNFLQHKTIKMIQNFKETNLLSEEKAEDYASIAHNQKARHQEFVNYRVDRTNMLSLQDLGDDTAKQVDNDLRQYKAFDETNEFGSNTSTRQESTKPTNLVRKSRQKKVKTVTITTKDRQKSAVFGSTSNKQRAIYTPVKKNKRLQGKPKSLKKNNKTSNKRSFKKKNHVLVDKKTLNSMVDKLSLSESHKASIPKRTTKNITSDALIKSGRIPPAEITNEFLRFMRNDDMFSSPSSYIAGCESTFTPYVNIASAYVQIPAPTSPTYTSGGFFFPTIVNGEYIMMHTSNSGLTAIDYESAVNSTTNTTWNGSKVQSSIASTSLFSYDTSDTKIIVNQQVRINGLKVNIRYNGNVLNASGELWICEDINGQFQWPNTMLSVGSIISSFRKRRVYQMCDLMSSNGVTFPIIANDLHEIDPDFIGDVNGTTDVDSMAAPAMSAIYPMGRRMNAVSSSSLFYSTGVSTILSTAGYGLTKFMPEPRAAWLLSGVTANGSLRITVTVYGEMLTTLQTGPQLVDRAKDLNHAETVASKFNYDFITRASNVPIHKIF
jgi:hypothetical protein